MEIDAPFIIVLGDDAGAMSDFYNQLSPTSLPRLGIHPDANQPAAARLDYADQLIESVSAGNGWVVLTHDELFVLRVRRRVIEGKIAPTDVALIYVDGKSGRRLTLDRFGQIPDWPPDLMREVTDERMALLLAQSDLLERGEAHGS
jgi:hypothetical protein